MTHGSHESVAIKVEQIDRSLLVRFVRPEFRNPLSVAVIDELTGVLDSIPETVDSLIFTGTDDVFASGADLREIATIDSDTARGFALRGQRLMSKIAALPQITIAGINGYCFGGALDLTLACDRRIASANATFAHPGAGLGIITGWGGTQRLPRLVGTANALEMLFTATPIGAVRALHIGLIDLIDDDPLSAAIAFPNARGVT